MKRNPSIERLFRWRFWSHEKVPSYIIPPRSVVRLIKKGADFHWDLKIGDEFRIGYYGRHDGPNCVWLVDPDGAYNQTWDQKSLLDYFEIISLSDETDTYGTHRPILGPL